MKLDGDSIKQFFVNHVEKIGFAVALALVGLFVYSGLQLEGYKRTPAEMRSQAEQAKTRIASYAWDDKLAAEDLDPKRNFSEEVEESTRDINARGYQTNIPLIPPNQQTIVKRGDPKILPPIQLEVDAVFGPVAERGQRDMFAGLETAPKPEAKVIRVRPQKSSKSKRGEDAMGMGMMGMGMDGDSGADTGEPIDEGNMGMEMGMGMGEGSGAAGGAPRGRQLPNPPSYWVVPNGAGSVSTMPAANARTGSIGVVGRVVIAVKALVPYEAQFDEFETTFQNCIDYRPSRRDRPSFLSFVVERAEVGADPDALTWQPLSNLPAARAQLARFPGRGRELVDPTYCMPNLLTMETPPVLMRDIDRLGLHSEIPLKHEKPEAVSAPDPSFPTVDPNNPLVPGNPVVPTGPAMGTGMESSEGMGMEGMGMEGMGMEGMGMEGSEGGMSGPGIMGGVPMTKYKLLRYFDTTATPGKKYRYRFRLVVADPNHPKEGPLNTRILMPEVVERIKQVQAQSKAAGYNIYFRFSEWSEPSPVIEAPKVGRLLAGPGEPLPRAKLFETSTGGIIPLEPQLAKAAAVSWGGRSLPTDISYATEASRGTVLNHRGDLKVLSPVTHELKLAKGVSLRSDSVVVDIQPIKTVVDDRQDPQVSTSLMAMVDASGNIVVRDEVDDVEDFRIYAFVDDQPPPVIDDGTGGAGADPMEGMGGMGGMGMDGIFGDDQ